MKKADKDIDVMGYDITKRVPTPESFEPSPLEEIILRRLAGINRPDDGVQVDASCTFGLPSVYTRNLTNLRVLDMPARLAKFAAYYGLLVSFDRSTGHYTICPRGRS